MTRVNRSDYIKYHFEYFLFLIPKIKDQVLQLLKLVYQTGLMKSDGLEKKVKKQSRVVEVGKFGIAYPMNYIYG